MMQDPISEITKAKRDRSRAQVVEHLPSKLKTLSSNPSTNNNKKLEFLNLIHTKFKTLYY
jgi:hypothetical protein